jgi:hypothetical protein
MGENGAALSPRKAAQNLSKRKREKTREGTLNNLKIRAVTNLPYFKK